jgi:hypothetical protein
MSQPANPDPLQLILQQLSTIKASNEALHATLANQDARHHEQMHALRQELEALKISSLSQTTTTEDTPAMAPPPPSPPSSPPRTTSLPASQRTERLPDPPMFTGKRKDLPLFLTKLRYKLRGNADRYPDEQAKLIYAHSRLERDPATLVDPLMDCDIQNVDQLILFLQSTYGDPNKELSAWSRLDSLKQGKKSFVSHFAEFRRLIADAGLNEAAQINQLRRSLSDELRQAMVGVEIPSQLNDYANKISLYDNDLRYLPSKRSYRYEAPKRENHHRDPDAMEIDTTNYAPLGSAERQKRIKEGSCFKCGRKGHISRNCSVPLPQIRARSSSQPSNSAPNRQTCRRRRSSASASSTTTRESRSPRGRRCSTSSHRRQVKASSRG